MSFAKSSVVTDTNILKAKLLVHEHECAVEVLVEMLLGRYSQDLFL